MNKQCLQKLLILGFLGMLVCFQLQASPAAIEKEEIIEDWQVHLELARVLSYQKKYTEAIDEYLLVIKEQPGDKQVRLELAKIYAYQGDEKNALEALGAIDKKELPEEKLKDLAEVYTALKKYDDAENYYQQYFVKHSDDLKARVKYAQMLSWQKKYPQSIMEFEKLLQQRPDDKQLRRKYAFVLLWNGDREKAAEELRKAL